MSVLLVDDDQWIRDSMALYFEAEGCHLDALESAEEGLEQVKRKDYDVFIIDYKLPGMSGLEFLEQLQETRPKAMKILITAYGSTSVISEASRMGVREIIQKPFTSETLEESLLRLMMSLKDRQDENEGVRQ